MPNEIYHRSNWGESKAEDFGDVYYDHAATNKLYNHSDYYENSDGTDATLKDLNNKASIVLTPTAYSDGSLNTVIPPYQVLPTELVTNGDFSNGTTNWTPNTNATLSIDNGRLKVAISGGSGYPSQNITTVVGKKYKITADAFIGTATKVSLYSAAFGFNDLTADGSYNLTFTATSTSTQIRLYVYGDGTYGFWDNVSIKEVQEADFDFSRGSSATRVNEQGLVENSQGDDFPRIDYTDGTGSLLLEPQRTNSLPYSEDFTQWTVQSGTTITSNTTETLSPSGQYNASKIVSNGSVGFYKQLSVTGVVSRSIYLKSVTGTVNVKLKDPALTVTTKTLSVTENWQRFELVESNGHASQSGLWIDDIPSSGIYAWAAQLESGNYTTSYIPTSGSTVTRSADVANNSGNADLFNDSEGVLYAEIAALADDQTYREIAISDGTSNNRIEIRYTNTSNTLQSVIRSGGTVVMLESTSSYNITNFNKIAVSYKANEFKMYVNSTEVAVDTSGNAPTGLKELAFDDGNGANDFYGDVKCVAVFKEALSNDLLERLTGEGYESFRLLAEANNYTII